MKWLMWLACYAAMAGVVAYGVWGLQYTRKVNPIGDPGAPVNFTVNADDTLESISERLQPALRAMPARSSTTWSTTVAWS